LVAAAGFAVMVNPHLRIIATQDRNALEPSPILSGFGLAVNILSRRQHPQDCL
jgi:hypothetical protein